MKEFQLIRQIQQQASEPNSGSANAGVVLGIGDDAAVLKLPDGQLLVAATDTLNAGIHFPEETSAFDIGYKCLAVNLSDLAAMGADPHWALLSLSLPEVEQGWAAAFIDGLMSLAKVHGVSLVGGDTTSGPMSISLTALGSVEPGQQMQRNGAEPGDLVVVSGTIGGAAYALDQWQRGEQVHERALLDRPEPRVSLGRQLGSFANSCIDISDGLLADLGHILDASGCGARLEVDNIPCSDALSRLDSQTRWKYQLSGGDDYELLFTLPEKHREKIAAWSKHSKVGLSIIGEIVDRPGIECVDPQGDTYQTDSPGFEHFRNNQ